ncbi:MULTISPECIES: GNAT family acetyltransferase [unclassified Leucobacter]|uniref:GNAT family acetyltransferase n=1 Tax=unclassified Leucobacter TaxID=2621730 RepID=UPI00165E16DF|nr:MULTISPECIES: GNAT family acetyltransferase [unclassified Leucobacter]MBC9927458.1 GNAT family acetyltransferase [Leucobacter sp. cx-169]MBC9936512.1 GNAT family acetyltransferase [Leucobacter sp. cx-87]
MQIRQFQPADTDAVVALWHEAQLTRPWNDPARDIERKLAEQPELFLVAEDIADRTLIGSVMAGTDGHRGWLYYLAVAGVARRRGVATALIAEAERLLEARGCPKVMLMVRRDNTEVTAMYEGLGYDEDEVLVLGKRLISDL